MKDQTWRITPNTPLGKRSVVLITVMPILFIVGTSLTDVLYKSVSAGGIPLADIVARPVLALTMLAGTVAGISSYITDLIFLIREKGRVLLVYVSTAIGALLIVFLVGIILFPD